jgi:hypothetical protein
MTTIVNFEHQFIDEKEQSFMNKFITTINYLNDYVSQLQTKNMI